MTSPADLQLMEAFGFTEEDILANRQGELTQRQQTKHNLKKLFFGTLLSLIGVPGGILLALSTNENTSRIGIGFIILGLLFSFGSIRLFEWLDVSTVRCETGTAIFKSIKGRLYLCIGRSILPVKPGLESLFTPGQEYDIYYSGSFATIFSIETAKDVD